MLIRPIRRDDLNALLTLARGAGAGLTSLPADEDYLGRRLEQALATFAEPRPPADTHLLFVLEDVASERVVGICGIEGAVGLTEPWYNYRKGRAVHASRALDLYRCLETLFLTNDLTGQAELCSLFLHADYRHSKNGSLLAKSRFLFLAEFPDAFDATVIAEMRGVSDVDGRSPFWESLGRHFFKMPFSRADYLTVVGQKSFIAELMPHHPLYVSFLSDEAQAVIGQVHEHTRPALSMLQAEGFRFHGYVDIFDAGPTVACERADIRAVRNSRVFEAIAGAPAGDPLTYLVANRRWSDYRAVLAHTRPAGDTLPLTPDVLARLDLQPGDMVRAVPLSPKEDVS